MSVQDDDNATDSLLAESPSEVMIRLRHLVDQGTASHVDRLNLRTLEVDLETSSVQSSLEFSPHRPTRIAIVSLLFNWPSTGGGIVHTAELAKFLSMSGYDICHFYAEYAHWQVGAIRSPLPYKNEAIHFTSSEWIPSSIRSRFEEAVDDFLPDCVIVTDSWNTKVLLAEAVSDFPYLLRLAAQECLCPLNNVRLLPTDHGRPRQCRLTQLVARESCVQCVSSRAHSSSGLHMAERQLAEFDRPEYGRRLRAAFENAHTVLAVNYQIAALVEAHARDVRVIPSGFDAKRFEGLPSQNRRKTSFRFLFAGLVSEYMKGFHVLLEACRHLWSLRQDFELWVTANQSEVVKEPFLTCCGWQSQAELPFRMAECDVVVVPTVAQEALGRTAVEAMGARRAVIASRLGGLREVVCDGVTGLLVEPADVSDLARGMETLLDDQELATHFGENGRRRFETTFAWEQIIDRHYKPLFDVCRRSA